MRAGKICSLPTGSVMPAGPAASRAKAAEVIVETGIAFEKTVGNFIVL